MECHLCFATAVTECTICHEPLCETCADVARADGNPEVCLVCSTAHQPKSKEWLAIRETERQGRKILYQRSKAILEGHSLANAEGEEHLTKIIQSFFKIFLLLNMSAPACIVCRQGIRLQQTIKDLADLTSPGYADLVVKGRLIDPMNITDILQHIIAQFYKLDLPFVKDLWEHSR